jgi:hypothetical protein
MPEHGVPRLTFSAVAFARQKYHNNSLHYVFMTFPCCGGVYRWFGSQAEAAATRVE